MNRKDFFLL